MYFLKKVNSSFSGRVSKALRDPVYGNLLVIDHRDGIQTRYAHASELLAAEGQEVRRGQMVARVGSTGRATGPHLHYEVIYKGQRVNPINFFFNDLTPAQYNQLLAQAAANNQSLD
jgi:murein DD-endopeptidase MepM/ murein hydrolase activator NlpD